MEETQERLRNPPSRRISIVDEINIPLEAVSDAKLVWVDRDRKVGRVVSVQSDRRSSQIITIHSIGHIEGISRREIKFPERNVRGKVVVTHRDSVELIGKVHSLNMQMLGLTLPCSGPPGGWKLGEGVHRPIPHIVETGSIGGIVRKLSSTDRQSEPALGGADQHSPRIGGS